MTTKCVAYFITGHGFGHSFRAATVMNGFPPEYRVVLFTTSPRSFFEEELNRDFELVECQLDCGCLQKDSVMIDAEATLKKYEAINANRHTLIDRFCKELIERKVDLVIADIPPLAFVVAAKANVPSIGISNFTWADIYEPYLSRFPEYDKLINQIKEDCSIASHYVLLRPGFEALECLRGKVVDAGLLARQGRSKREDIASAIGLDPKKKWCYFYIGPWGLDLDWSRVAKMSEQWQFFGFDEHKGAPANYIKVKKDKDKLLSQDLVASCDLVFSKLGYGLISECLRFGKPILFLPRVDFAEYDLFKKYLEGRGQGVEIAVDDFRSFNIAEPMDGFVSKASEPLAAGALEVILGLVAAKHK